MIFQKSSLNGRLVLIAYLMIQNLEKTNCSKPPRVKLPIKKKPVAHIIPTSVPAPSSTSTLRIPTLSFANNTINNTAINSNWPVLKPYDYNVRIRFVFEDNTLLGKCSISMHIQHLLQTIKMNSVPIRIIEAFLIKINRIVYNFSSFTNDNNILAINFADVILPAVYTLNVTYMRLIDKNNSDLFISEYKENIKQKLNQTGVEVIRMSELFPFVESVNRSRFNIAIKHDEDYTILSNVPIRARYKANKKNIMWTHFNEVLLLPQHLTVVITTFTHVSSEFENVTIWCRQSARQYVNYAIDVTETIVQYFRQKYMTNFSKLDIVAFWHSDGENDATLGLVLQREADIIYDETLHSVIHKREVANMIARQLAFLWCEDAVLWSKEGFTTYFGAHILNEVYPDTHVMDLMVVQAQQDSLRYDVSSIEYSPTLKSTNTSEVSSLRPSLNYMKSFIIWRMLNILLRDIFWTGIRKYINNTRIYSNMTTSDNLWTTIQTVYSEIYPNHVLIPYFQEIITTWITKKFYPVLKGTSSTVFYILSHYLLDNDETMIWLPVISTSQSESSFTLENLVMVKFTKEESFAFNKEIGERNWFIINIQQAGYYRVNYDFENWEKLMHYLNSKDYNKIHILNRAQIIDDAFYFFLRRNVSYDLFWNLTNFVIQDTNFVIWYPMFKVFESLTCIYPLEHGKSITEKIKSRIDLLITKIGYFEKPDDRTFIKYVRQEAIKWACILGISECRRIAASELRKTFENSVGTNNMVKNIWIYCRSLLTTVNYVIWYEIRDKWIATSDRIFLEYLTCFENSKIVCNFLKMTLLEKVQSDDSKGISRRVSAFIYIVAKYVKNDEMHSCLLQIINSSSFAVSSNRENDVIATLIVIITHVHAEDHLKMIENEAINILNKTRLLEGVKIKIKKRKLEYGRLISYYGYLFSVDF